MTVHITKWITEPAMGRRLNSETGQWESKTGPRGEWIRTARSSHKEHSWEPCDPPKTVLWSERHLHDFNEWMISSTYEADGPMTIEFGKEDLEELVRCIAEVRMMADQQLGNGGNAAEHARLTILLSKFGVSPEDMA